MIDDLEQRRIEVRVSMIHLHNLGHIILFRICTEFYNFVLELSVSFSFSFLGLELQQPVQNMNLSSAYIRS